MPRLIVQGFPLSLAPRTFRPALPEVLTTLAALACCTWSHAQIIDSTYILSVDRRVQGIDAAKDHGIRTLENEESLAYATVPHAPHLILAGPIRIPCPMWN